MPRVTPPSRNHLDLNQNLRPDKLRNYQQQECRSSITERLGPRLYVTGDVLGPRQLLVDLHDVLDAHPGLVQYPQDVFPCQLRLPGDVPRQLLIRQ
jgi:hypothetical protein